jgi:hypothetical protein
VKNQRFNRETSEGAVHMIRIYSAGVDPKDPALKRFPTLKNKKSKVMNPFVNPILSSFYYIYILKKSQNINKYFILAKLM